MRKKYIAGSSKCTPKSLSVILLQKLTIVKVVFRLVKKSSFYKGRFSKNSKELLKHLVSNTLSSVKRIKPFPFFFILQHYPSFWIQRTSKSFTWYAFIIKVNQDIIKAAFIWFVKINFQQTIGIPMGTNCAPLFVGLFLFIANIIFAYFCQIWKKTVFKSYNSKYRSINDVLFSNYKEFENMCHLF